MAVRALGTVITDWMRLTHSVVAPANPPQAHHRTVTVVEEWFALMSDAPIASGMLAIGSSWWGHGPLSALRRVHSNDAITKQHYES